MSCCGHSSGGALGQNHRVRMCYGGGRPIVVKGAATGAEYRFSGKDRFQLMDPRDALIVSRNPMFRVETIVEVDEPELHSPSGNR
jgi:hypothetical protein